jgi:penicillin-binding protein activator
LKKIITISMLAFVLSGCETMVTSTNPNAARADAAGGMQSMQLQSVDWEYAAKKAVDEFLASKFSSKPGGGRYVVAMGDVVNDTTLDIRTQSLTSQMKGLMTRTGSFIFTGAVGSERTNFVRDSRQLNQSAMFDRRTTARNNTVIAPDLEMSGAIRQRTVTGSGNRQALEYEFDFRVVEVHSGLEIFQSFVKIDKTGSNQKFAW